MIPEVVEVVSNMWDFLFQQLLANYAHIIQLSDGRQSNVIFNCT